MRLDIIKIDKDLFNIREIKETWCLNVFDYIESSMGYSYTDGKYHRVMADSEYSANDLCDRAYKEYKDKKVEILYAEMFLKHIVFEHEKKQSFNTRDLLNTFVEGHKGFSDADYSVIMKYKELLQKERHHNKLILTMMENGRATEKALRIQAGLPMDMC